MNTEREKRRNVLKEFSMDGCCPDQNCATPQDLSRPELPNSGTPELLL